MEIKEDMFITKYNVIVAKKGLDGIYLNRINRTFWTLDDSVDCITEYKKYQPEPLYKYSIEKVVTSRITVA
jgi:hypothetical protein